MFQPFRISAILATWLCVFTFQAHGAAGARDIYFNPVLEGGISAVALQPDGKIVVGGGFTNINGINRSHIARLNPDGSVDESFNPGVGIAGTSGLGSNAPHILALAIQSDGKVLVGGTFTNVGGLGRNCIARLDSCGSLDTSFDPGTGVEGLPGGAIVEAIAIQPNGQIMLGGHFSFINGTNRNSIARLNPDGSLDDSIFWIDSVSPEIHSLAIQSDSKVVVGGRFGLKTNVNITRLNADGSRDASFDSTGVSADVASMALQPDGKLLIGGGTGPMIGRLGTNGALDGTFNAGTGVNGWVMAIAVQADGKVLIAGAFTEVNGVPRNRIARLSADGSVDASFNPGAGLSGPCSPFCPWASALAVQKNGRIIIGGSFSTVDNTACKYLVRLLGDEAVVFSGPVQDAGDFVARFRGTTGLVYTVEYQTSCGATDWQKLTNLAAPAGDDGFGVGVFELRDPFCLLGQRFYRVVYPAY